MRSGKGRRGFGTALQQSAVPFFSPHLPITPLLFPLPQADFPSRPPPNTRHSRYGYHFDLISIVCKTVAKARMVNECVIRNPFAERGRRREAFGRRKVRSGQRLTGHERRSLGAPRRAHSGSRRTLEEGRGASRRRLLHLPRRAQSLRPHRQRMGGPAAQARRPHRPLERGRQRTDVQVAAGARQAHVTRPRRPLPNSLRDNRHSHSDQP